MTAFRNGNFSFLITVVSFTTGWISVFFLISVPPSSCFKFRQQRFFPE